MAAGVPEALFERPVRIQQRVCRNVTSRRQSADLFAEIADDAADSQAAIAAEMRTRPRVGDPVINRPFETGVGIIGVPGAPRDWNATRFSDGSFGVWYGSLAMETTIAETTYHFVRQLRDQGLADHDQAIVRHRAVHSVALDALLFDLRAQTSAYPGLTDPTSHTFTHRVGRVVHDGGHPGLITLSARKPRAENVAVFDPRYLSDPRLICYPTYRYQPQSGGVDVDRQPDTCLGRWQPSVKLGAS